MKNILITGVSTGIGKNAAEYLLKKGYRVFGSVRKLSDSENLKIRFTYIKGIFSIETFQLIYQKKL